MKIKHLFIIDPLERLHINFDTSILIINEALKRGHEVYFCTEYEISFNIDSPVCFCAKVEDEVFPNGNQYLFNLKKNCDDFNFIHIRKDPPYNSDYHALLMVLKYLKKATPVNNPESLMRFNEKESILLFPDLICETTISSSKEHILSFLKHVGGKAVLKPLYYCNGYGVIELNLNDPELDNKLNYSTADEKNKVIVQKFLENVYTSGETRVFMLEDEPLSIIKKIPSKGSFLANFDLGAHGEKYNLNERELQICKQIGTFCKKHGIILSALDIIDGFISEINITSPGLLVESNSINNKKYEKIIIDYFERRA